MTGVDLEAKRLQDAFSTRKVLLPVIIGLLITAVLIWRSWDVEAMRRVEWTWSTTFWICMAALSLVVRDWAYMIRIRHLADKELSWYRTFVVIMLWEFASALAPDCRRRFPFAILILTREGIAGGKSITIIPFTSFLDGIFLAVMAPLVYFTIGRDALFTGIDPQAAALEIGFFASFWTVYFIILGYKVFVGYALFVNPVFVKRALVGIFSAPLLRRWRRNMVTTGDQLIVAAEGLQKRGWDYWWPALLATFVSWTARFSIVNCILHAFHPSHTLNDAVIYGKQVIMDHCPTQSHPWRKRIGGVHLQRLPRDVHCYRSCSSSGATVALDELLPLHRYWRHTIAPLDPS